MAPNHHASSQYYDFSDHAVSMRENTGPCQQFMYATNFYSKKEKQYLDSIEQSLGVRMLLEVIANRLGKNKKFIRSDEYILLA